MVETDKGVSDVLSAALTTASDVQAVTLLKGWCQCLPDYRRQHFRSHLVDGG